LSDTVLGKLFNAEERSTEQSQGSSTSSSIAGPGPFYCPIVDSYFSSDSSYCPSRQRDILLRYDTDNSSSASSKSLAGHREAYWQRREEAVHELLRPLESIVIAHNSDSTSISSSCSDSGHLYPSVQSFHPKNNDSSGSSATATSSSFSLDDSSFDLSPGPVHATPTVALPLVGDGGAIEVPAMLAYLASRRLPTADNLSASSQQDQHFPFRSTPLQPPEIELDADAPSIPPTGHRQQQGTAISPALYSAVWNLAVQQWEANNPNLAIQPAEDDISATSSMPSLIPPVAVGMTQQQQAAPSSDSASTPAAEDISTKPSLPDLNPRVEAGAPFPLLQGDSANEYGYYNPDNSNGYYGEFVTGPGGEFLVATGGDTVASTVSYLSSVGVQCVAGMSALQLEGKQLRSPIGSRMIRPMT